MNLDICKKCNECSCLIFFKKVGNECFADIMKVWDYCHTEIDYQRKNRDMGVLIGIRMATSDAVVEKKFKSIELKNIPCCSGIANYKDLYSDSIKIEDEWDFEKYVPYDRCKNICPYWMEHKVSSLSSGEKQ